MRTMARAPFSNAEQDASFANALANGHYFFLVNFLIK